MIEDACIDLSHYQTFVDFNVVHRAGIKLVIHKATEGTKSTDARYATRESLARSVGLAWGAYHFMRTSSGAEQAEHFLRVVRPKPGALCVIDLEAAWTDSAQFFDQAEVWCARVEAVTEVPVLLYSTAAYLKDVPAGSTLCERPLWIARYPVTHGVEAKAYSKSLRVGTIPPPWKDSTLLWQYTSKGAVPGIGGNVDRNVGDVDSVIARYPGCATT